jgi:hypothetical protein
MTLRWTYERDGTGIGEKEMKGIKERRLRREGSEGIKIRNKSCLAEFFFTLFCNIETCHALCIVHF